MRSWLLFGTLFITFNTSAQTPAGKLWTDPSTKREALPSLHQEFDVMQIVKTGSNTQNEQYKTVLDLSQNKWRERTVSGSDDRIRFFDGQDLFLMDTGGDEYVRTKRKPKDSDPIPRPYSTELDLTKATEVERLPCGFPGTDQTCIIIQAPIKLWMRPAMDGRITRMSDGIVRVSIDGETGMLVESDSKEAIDDGRGGYQLEMTFTLRRLGYTSAADDALFKLPESAVHEVKELTPWNVARIKKELVGKPAPELNVTDIEGNPVSLSALKGKTILLDFWTTWCPPCRADAPELDKLYKKYGGKDLVIVGLSVGEQRDIVKTFLKDHPHAFPVVLTTENEMPRPYQIGEFPTYMVIAPDGVVATAVAGDQGFGELRKFLEKAGMQID